MNKHGQTLVLFVILIPIMIVILAIVVDTGLVISKKIQLKEVTKMVIEEILVDENKDINKLFTHNDINIDNLEVIDSGNTLRIKNKIQVDSIFGVIIGIKTYDIKIDIVGYQQNGKIIYE